LPRSGGADGWRRERVLRASYKCGRRSRRRLKGNLLTRIGSRKATTGDLALSGAHYFQDVALTGKCVSTSIGIIHDAGHAERWIIAMSAGPSYLSTLSYSHRWDIEPVFSDFKSRGFGIQDTQIHYPDRLGRLILVMSLALYWAVSTGMWDAAENPTPSAKKIGASTQKARQKQALLVHPRTARSCQAHTPSPAAAKALGVPAKLMDGEPVRLLSEPVEDRFGGATPDVSVDARLRQHAETLDHAEENTRGTGSPVTIDYVGDTGFTADGEFIEADVLHHAGMVLIRSRAAEETA